MIKINAVLRVAFMCPAQHLTYPKPILFKHHGFQILSVKNRFQTLVLCKFKFKNDRAHRNYCRIKFIDIGT